MTGEEYDQYLEKNMTGTQRIGHIGNYHGDLNVGLFDGKYFWSIENHDGFFWEEIPEDLHSALLRYEANRHIIPKTDFESIEVNKGKVNHRIFLQCPNGCEGKEVFKGDKGIEQCALCSTLYAYDTEGINEYD